VRRLLVLALVLAGCGGAAPTAPDTALRKVDDFPLYELTDTLPTPSVFAAVDATGWACTVFFGARGDPIMGRNFDFHDEPALLLRHRPPGAYASISLVDISYLGFDRAHLSRLADPVARRALQQAAQLPFDGMNERGVAVAMAAVPAARSAPGRASGSLGVMRLVLDNAANVSEAVAIFRRTAVDFAGGPPLHYLVADAGGASAVVEYVGGRVRVIPRGARPWQAMTNFVLTGARSADRRYRTATAALERAEGRLTTASTLDLLRRVKQPITRWSAAYDLRARTVQVVMGQKYGGRVLTFGVR
jgi:predicted choloylglycine hydrolase